MVSLALQDAYLQVPIHHDSRRYLRFVVPKKDVPVRGPLLRSHNLAPRLHEDYGSHFRHPPQVWTIDSSWPLQNSSLVYLGVKFGLCLLWLDLLQRSQQSPATTRGVSVNPISSSVPLASYPGPLIVPYFSRP